MIDIEKIADEADLIVNGYAFTVSQNQIKILNLNFPDCATNLALDGKVLETNMNDIELSIVLDYFKQNSKFLEL